MRPAFLFRTLLTGTAPFAGMPVVVDDVTFSNSFGSHAAWVPGRVVGLGFAASYRREMKDVRVDGDGELRCWNCGMKGLLAKRTFRSKVLVGVGALLTKKKLKCQTCGEYNDTGNAKPFTGPDARKWRKVYEKEQKAKTSAQIAAEDRAATAAARALVAEVARAQAAGITYEADDDELPPPPPPPAGITLPAGWHADPTQRHELRYWTGTVWTSNVSDHGTQASDPYP